MSRRRPGLRRAGLAAALLLPLLAAGWAAGLVHFVSSLPRQPPSPPPASDGIVVLTGGAARIEAGFALLHAGKGRRLFISGVHPGLRKATLSAVDPGYAALLACCVDLGFTAADTFGNAIETAAWVRGHNYRSLLVVTANYHMPRALIELKRRLPGVLLRPYPVVPDQLKLDHWWIWRGSASLLVQEYDKYLLALVIVRLDQASGGRLEHWLADREGTS